LVADIFDEVEEQLRSEKYRNIFFRVLPWAVGLGLAALIGAFGWWGWDSWHTRAANKASENYSVALDLVQSDPDRAFTKFEEVVKGPSRAYKALALMQQGAIRLEAHKTPEAVKLYDQAAKDAPDVVIADMARLKSALALMDTAPYAAMEERLKPLTEEKRPYRAEAFEALAMAKLQAGRAKDARSDFSVLTLMASAPQSVRERAQAAISLIDSGSAKELPAVVKAAAALPPMPTLPPGLLPQAAPQPDASAGAAG
jgi:hypothetical protein